MSKPQVRSAVKFNLFADTARKRKIETLGDPLQIVTRHIDCAHLNQVIDALLPGVISARAGVRRTPRGHAAHSGLKQLYNLSDEQSEYQLLDRMSYQRFCLLTDSANIPYRNTIWDFQWPMPAGAAGERPKPSISNLFPTLARLSPAVG